MRPWWQERWRVLRKSYDASLMWVSSLKWIKALAHMRVQCEILSFEISWVAILKRPKVRLCTAVASFGLSVHGGRDGVRCYPLGKEASWKEALEPVACIFKVLGVFDYFYDVADDSRNGNVECLHASPHSSHSLWKTNRLHPPSSTTHRTFEHLLPRHRLQSVLKPWSTLNVQYVYTKEGDITGHTPFYGSREISHIFMILKKSTVIWVTVMCLLAILLIS
jgi:hypothetical protein